MDDKNAIQVKMFGNFSAYYHQKSLLEAGGRDSQFINVMQLLWYSMDKGVSRANLMEAVLGGRDSDDPSHALRSALYRAKKRLQKLGLPDCEYIIKKEGNYCWNSRIAVDADVHSFDRLIEEANTETDEDVKLKKLIAACRLYRGEFLADYASGLWVTHEARLYRERFRLCVDEAAHILRRKKDYQRLRKLGEHASKTDPCANWEVLTMEALCYLRKKEEAVGLYERTVDFYLEECGASPSVRLRMYLNRIDDSREYTDQLLDSIQDSLEEGQAEGGYVCSALTFQGVYQMIQRISERGGQSVCLMMCTVQDENGHPFRDDEKLEEMADGLCSIIQRSVRHGDIISRYSKNIYLVLLVNICLEDCGLVQKRISRLIQEKGMPCSFGYRTNNLIPHDV